MSAASCSNSREIDSSHVGSQQDCVVWFCRLVWKDATSDFNGSKWMRSDAWRHAEVVPSWATYTHTHTCSCIVMFCAWRPQAGTQHDSLDLFRSQKRVGCQSRTRLPVVPFIRSQRSDRLPASGVLSQVPQKTLEDRACRCRLVRNERANPKNDLCFPQLLSKLAASCFEAA